MKKIIFLISAAVLFLGTTVANAQNNSKNIVEIASSVDDFSTLVTALDAADLVGALQGEGPFTVFAPVNSGFAKIDPNALNSLLQPQNKSKLSEVLTYHVVSGNITSSDVAAALKKGNGMVSLTTLNGAKLTAVSKDGGIFLKDQNGNYSKIAKTDVMASNGVIHVIEDVVMP